MTDIMRKILERVLSKFAYHAMSTCTVASQSTDGTRVDVRTDRFGAVRNALLVPAFPGLTIRVSQGAKGLLAFENGDPDKPLVLVYAGTITEYTLDCPNISLGGPSGAKVLRVSDTLNLTGTMSGSPFTATATVSPSLGSTRVSA